MDFQAVVHSAFLTGAISGFLSAAVVDVGAFQKWKTIQEAATYDWGVALWRWLQGFLAGGLGATVFKGLVP